MVMIRKDRKPDRIGRIHLPDSGNQSTLFGLVLASGPETVRKLDGKRVLVPVMGGQEVDLNDGEGRLVFLEEDRIVALVEE
jgi:co-chaperonin GroES (HSP10)